MTATIERSRPRTVVRTISTTRAEISLPTSVTKKETAATQLHNMLVMTAPPEARLPDPARVEREMGTIRALSKDTSIAELATASLRTTRAAYEGDRELRFIHEIGPVTTSLIALRDKIATKIPTPPQFLDAVIETLCFLAIRGLRDASSLEKAKNC